MNRRETTENWKIKVFKNGRQSENGIICKGNKDEELASPRPESEIPWEEPLNHQEFSWRARIIVAIGLIIILASVFSGLPYESVKYSSTINYCAVGGALICMSIINLTMCFDTQIFRRSSNKNILLALFAAAHLCTHPFYISRLLNF
ncbi:uncharacterized protein LOC108040477 [Drosophila rhopaloa]|uniref:Uncharacterized protein LOC108040477 n=1 Tax=Drosophila rhopaloa TaxID=1041015 RepID=A0A6P4EEI7_DRORH|nr:uncharacterized protein LOC108040477 [Drosophila rhopaloa]